MNTTPTTPEAPFDMPDSLALTPEMIAMEAARAMNPNSVSAALRAEPFIQHAIKLATAQLRADGERLTWLIKQGPPGAAEGIGLNEDAWDCATAYVEDDGNDQEAMRSAIDAARAQTGGEGTA